MGSETVFKGIYSTVWIKENKRTLFSSWFLLYTRLIYPEAVTGSASLTMKDEKVLTMQMSSVSGTSHLWAFSSIKHGMGLTC
jgi:hypothetical protein